MEHLNSSISAGERESLYLSAAPVQQSQASSVVAQAGRASQPRRAAQPHKRSKATAAVALPEESSESEGESQNNIVHATQLLILPTILCVIIILYSHSWLAIRCNMYNIIYLVCTIIKTDVQTLKQTGLQVTDEVFS